VDSSSPTAQSPTTSPPPTSTSKTSNTSNTGNSNQNGRHLQALPYTQQNGRNYLFSQHFLLHPAFRGLTARTQLPGVTSGKLHGGFGITARYTRGIKYLLKERKFSATTQSYKLLSVIFTKSRHSMLSCLY
jgi:hypothetical protein